MAFPKVHAFHKDISHIPLPEKFTFPFYYTPNPLAIAASQQLQAYLMQQQDFVHNFGRGETTNSLEIGKMFGVLVVKDYEGNLGFLAAFSGKLADSNDHAYFVPPVFDLLSNNDFFLPEIKELNKINESVKALQESVYLQELEQTTQNLYLSNAQKLEGYKQYCSKQKELRAQVRKAIDGYLPEENKAIVEEYLVQQSVRDSYEFKKFQKLIKQENEAAEKQLESALKQLNDLKQERKTRSAALQDLIFQHYSFMNAAQEVKSLYQIFNKDLGIQPLAGAGECSAPKLLQYAFAHKLEPICMAEFWWGKSPKSEIRQHLNYYPACRGKCEPILKHMLSATTMDEDVLKIITPVDCEVNILYEDEYLAAVSKPSNFLSVPGKFMDDCVYKRMKQKYPQATGPIVVHRLDMATSGVMLIAKDKYTHELLQRQFIKKTIEKRYVALLEGVLASDQGEVVLPLRVDLEDRPRQLVCYEYGKYAKTLYQKISITEGKTRVHFWPVTGRTHQLRVHAAHASGLNLPIVGDEFYGTRADRLYLHAAEITFIHPKYKQKMTIQCPEPF